MLQYTEPLDIHIGTNIPESLANQVEVEFTENKDRYKVNGKHSKGEIYRSALRVFFRLQKINPDLFRQLRDAELLS